MALLAADNGKITLTLATIPEPASMALGAMVLGLPMLRRRRTA